MQTAGSPRSNGAGGAAVPALKRALLLRRLARASYTLIAIGVFAVVAGFVWFLWQVSRDEVTLDRNADGIVVLTGGASRIADAIELLSAARGRRLLVTGVHRTTTTREIARLMPVYRHIIEGRVDLDHSAVNTLGNAIETRSWADRNNFRSLIVVTSSYHMPRAMLELAHQLPEVNLIPYPVVSEKIRAEPWWSSEATARLLLSEYLKCIVAVVRIGLEPFESALSRLSERPPGVLASR
jgi:uncharacterized SAM-binding protein YcdF (DUF218 family)